MIVKGKVECSGLLTGREGFIEPNCKDTTCRGFLIARSVNTVQSTIEVAIQITNIAPREVILYQGSQVADFYVGHRVMQIDSRSCESRQSNERPSVDLTGTDLTQSQKQKLEDLIWEFRSLFVTEGGPTGWTSNVKHAIITNGLPVREPIRRIPHALQETVKLEVKKMLKDGVIRESNSPWSSPIVMIKKKDGSWRFCVDFRKVNSMTQKDAYPLPRIDEALEALTGSQFFTTLDLASGYWQVEMEEADRKKTAFSTREGHFEFNVMPFGLTNAPATFQRLMECVLAGLTYEQCLIYLDDIVVFSVTFDQHLERLKMVFHHLAEAGLKLKPSKCHFAKSEIRYLGHIVSRQGIQADPDKTSAMISFPVPSDIKELRQFLGLTNYYRRFIKGYSSIAEPLHKLTRKTEGGFKWNSECQNAFQHLKHLLVSPPILAYPQFQLPFVVASDASGCAIGAVLSQEHEGEEKVIAYWSRQLSKAERNYSTIEREALAVVRLKREQAADEFTSKMVRAIVNGMSPPDEKWSKFFLEDGVLCHHAKSVKNPKTQTVIPKSLRTLVFELLHSKSGHLGVHKTLEKVKERFFFPGYEQDIREAVKKCEACQRCNTPVPVPQAPLGTIKSEYPFQRLSWDIMGPLPATSCGNKYILVVTDVFSKWVEAFPLAVTDSITLARILTDEVICRYGVPESLHSDQGANFVSEVMQSLCAQLGIKRTQTSAYHREGNGQVERFNRTLEAMLSKVDEEHQKEWDCHLQKVLFSFRTAVHESTGYTPLFVMSGRSPNLPIDVLLVGPVNYHVQLIGGTQKRVVHRNRLKPCLSDPEPESDVEIKNPEPSSSKQVTPEDNNTHMEVVQDMTLPEVFEDETVIPVEIQFWRMKIMCFVDSDEVSPEIGLQNAESFYGSAGRSSSRICHIKTSEVTPPARIPSADSVFGSAAVKFFLTNEEMEAWKCIAIGMMSEEETTGDGKIERRRPSWRSEEYTIGWMSWIDGEQTHGKWPGKKGLMDLFSSYRPRLVCKPGW
ncbi:hypothetical protein EMCRGX_G030811 [Ephydatia muelleri]